MNINEVRTARAEMEIAIRAAVHQAVSEFNEKTGLSPSAIIIDLVDVTCLGRNPDYLVGEVHAHVRL